MSQHARLYSSRSPRDPAGCFRDRGCRERGYVLLVVMIAATLLLISLTAALPNAYVAGQREKEEELIFRGNEYARAIALFQRQFKRYPASVKELLQTSGIRFLRREYPDPMSRKGKWRFIYADANGVVLNSKTLGPPQRRPPGAGASTSSTSREETRSPGATEEESGSTSSFFDNQPKGTFIVGVASTARRKSIRVWNGRTRYDEWEFIGLATNITGPAPGEAPGQSGQPGQPPSPFPRQQPPLPVLPPLMGGSQPR